MHAGGSSCDRDRKVSKGTEPAIASVVDGCEWGIEVEVEGGDKALSIPVLTLSRVTRLVPSSCP